MTRLTQGDIDSLRALIGTEAQWASADRVGFYVRYYELIKAHNQGGAFQVLMQAHIASYSGFAGGGALIGNAIAKFSNPDIYQISLDHFSWRIARGLFDSIVAEWSTPGGTGIFSAEKVIASDNAVWTSEGLREYFPGLIQQSRMDYTTLFTAGTIGGALSALQLIFGAQVGFTQSDRLGNGVLDASNPDYTVVRDNQGRIIWIEEHVGALDASFGVPRFVTDEPGRALILGLVAAFTVGGPVVFATGLAAVGALAGLSLFNSAAGRAVAVVITGSIRSLWTDSEFDYGLRAELAKYLGAAGEEVDPDGKIPNGLTYGNFPIILRNDGIFHDSSESTILGGYSTATVYGNGGEDILYGFSSATLHGGADDDLLLGKDDAVLNGDEGRDTLIVGGRAIADGGAGNDTLFGLEESISRGGAGDDILFGFHQAELEGGTGNDSLLHFGSGTGFAGDGSDLLISWGATKRIYGEGGNDILISLSGEGAYLYGGTGADILVGWSGGEDHLFGNDGASASDNEQDLFFISHRTFVHNAGTEDRVYLGP